MAKMKNLTSVLILLLTAFIHSPVSCINLLSRNLRPERIPKDIAKVSTSETPGLRKGQVHPMQEDGAHP